MHFHPVRIRLDKPNRSLVVDWSDGVRRTFPWPLLRARCPSATERAARELADKNPLQVLAHVPSSDLAEVRAVGNYAINLVWADGHSAGIYTWEYLLQISDDPRVHSEGIA